MPEKLKLLDRAGLHQMQAEKWTDQTVAQGQQTLDG